MGVKAPFRRGVYVFLQSFPLNFFSFLSFLKISARVCASRRRAQRGGGDLHFVLSEITLSFQAPDSDFGKAQKMEHGPWLSRTLSIVLVRHRLNHSQTCTEFCKSKACRWTLGGAPFSRFENSVLDFGEWANKTRGSLCSGDSPL